MEMHLFFKLSRYKKEGGGLGHIAKVDIDGFHLSVCVFALESPIVIVII